MRDSIELARLGTPAIALVTETFWPQGNFVSAAAGMPDIPRVQLPHPVAGSGNAAMAAVAADIAGPIIAVLRGASTSGDIDTGGASNTGSSNRASSSTVATNSPGACS